MAIVESKIFGLRKYIQRDNLLTRRIKVEDTSVRPIGEMEMKRQIKEYKALELTEVEFNDSRKQKRSEYDWGMQHRKEELLFQRKLKDLDSKLRFISDPEEYDYVILLTMGTDNDPELEELFNQYIIKFGRR